jgi:hypothetical protein
MSFFPIGNRGGFDFAGIMPARCVTFKAARFLRAAPRRCAVPDGSL